MKIAAFEGDVGHAGGEVGVGGVLLQGDCWVGEGEGRNELGQLGF